jgi:hypothetical protein
VKVRRGLAIRGRAIDSAGEPVGRGEVRVDPEPLGDPRPARDGTLRRDGTFEVGGLPEGLYSLSVAVPPEFLHETVRGVRAGGGAIEVRLRRPGGVIGRVVFPPDAPADLVPEVTLRALEDTTPLPAVHSRRIASEDLRIRVGPVTPAAYAVSVVAGEWRADRERVVVGEAPPTDLGDVVLSRGGAVEGTVRVGGTPAAGVPVEVLRYLPGGMAESAARARTGPDGRYRVGGLRAGPHSVAVRPQDRPLVEAPFGSAPGGTGALDVEVPLGARLAVRVLLPGGEPAAGARVTVSGEAGGVLFWKEGSPGEGPHATGGDGTLRCAGLPAGSFRVSASLAGSGTGDATVTLAEGGEAAVEVRLAK